MAANQETKSLEKDSLTTLFKIHIPDHRNMVFQSCEGLESEIEVLFYDEGGNLGAPKTARGRHRVNQVTFTHGTSMEGNGKSIFDWYQEVADSSKPLVKRTLSIVVANGEGTTLAEWRVLNAWPCRWRAPTLSTELSEVGLELICFAHEGIERKK